MTRRTLAAAVAVVTLLLSASCAGHPAKSEEVVYSPEYPHFQSAKDLFARANLVIKGRVTDKARTEEVGTAAPADPTDPKQNPKAGAPLANKEEQSGPIVVTVRKVQVLQVIKGNVSGSPEIDVKELGGTVKGVVYREEEASPLVPGVTYLLFLETYPDSPASLLNSSQAKYKVDSTGSLVGVPSNEIKITENDLAQLAKTG